MRARVLLLLSLAACSRDWSLARQTGASGAGGGAPLESATVLCDHLPALQSDPTIDGQLEPGLALYSWLAAGSANIPSGMDASLSLAHRPGGLYFFAEVADPTRDPAPAGGLSYCGDSVELFVDDDGVIQNPPGYDIPGTMQLILVAPADDVTPERRGQRFVFPGTSTDSTDLGAWTSTRFIAVPTATGYAVEAFVVASDLDLPAWALAPGGKLGWDVSLNIGGPEQPGIDACTTRSQQVHFRLAPSGACVAPYCNASALCVTTLSGP
jgi:hypothetical protein